MRFFIFQPEVLSTINVIMGSKIGNIPSALIFGGLFIVILTLGIIFLRKKYSFSSIIIYSALFCWLPLLVQFSYNASKEFNDTWFALFQPESEQTIWRYCRVDKYQNLSGSLCAVYPFIEQVRNNIAEGSSIALLRSSSNVYLSYHLYNDYNIRSITEADYLILYLPASTYSYDNGILYEGTDKKTVLGSFEPLASFGPDQIVFKRKIK